tara:strand:+ start:435 stop:1151 length:717 start_codon:yes stop_codon:yes gene_type:complete
MELLSKHIHNKTFSDRIKPSEYQQNTHSNNLDIQNSTVHPSIIDLFFTVFDHHYTLIENKGKQLYLNQRLIGIATEIDEDKKNKYDKFNYSKYMNSTLIQHGLQSMNTVSALLYLSDYYNVSTNVYIESSSNVKVKTSEKTRKEFNIMYTQARKWTELSVKPDYKNGTFEDLGLCLTIDVKSKDIYNKYLNPIGKYKAPELIEIAKEMNLPLEKDGKKKVKKELYDDINFYQLNLNNV